MIAAYLGVADEEVGAGRSGGRPMTAPLLSVRGVTAFYGHVMALKGVDLDVNAGEIVTLIGANGAGKSTLMMTICGNPRARDGASLSPAATSRALPTHEIARLQTRAIARRPPHLSAHDGAGKSADGRDRRRAGRDSTAISSACWRCFPRLQAAPRPARRHAVGRRAADAGDRARADEPAAASCCSTSRRSGWRR